MATLDQTLRSSISKSQSSPHVPASNASMSGTTGGFGLGSTRRPRARTVAQLPPLKKPGTDVIVGLASTMRQSNLPTSSGNQWRNKPVGGDPRSQSFRKLEMNPQHLVLSPARSGKRVFAQRNQYRNGDSQSDAEEPMPKPHVDRIRSMYLRTDGMNAGEEDEVGLPTELAKVLDEGAEEVNEEELLDEEVDRVKTGEDAIAFFAKNSSSTKIKIMYCNRPRQTDCTIFAPYDLEVLKDEKKTNSEYFTISANGIVHICPGQLAESISLVEWMHQSLMYRVLTSMAFFKYYLHRKCFSLWRSNARYEVYCHNRLQLSRACFFAKPLFVEPLAQLHSLIYEVEEVKVLSIDKGQSNTNAYQLAEFAELQHNLRANPQQSAQKEFEQKHDAGLLILDRLVNVVMCSIDSEPVPKEALHGKSKSMVQEKQEKAERLRHQAIARKDADTLGDCIRLVDYMFQAALVSVVVQATHEFVARVSQTHPTKLFYIFVAGFSEKPGHVLLDPHIDVFRETLNRLLEGTIQVAAQVPTFATQRQYERFTRIISQQSLREVVLNDRTYLKNSKNILGYICDAIEAAQAWANGAYEGYQKICDFSQWDEEAWEAQDHTYDSIYADMTLVKGYMDELDQFPPSSARGIIWLDAKRMKNDLTPIPETAMNIMKKKLTSMAKDRLTVTLQRYEKTNRGLDARPDELGKFVTYIKDFKAVQEEKPELEELMVEVETMYNLMNTYNVKVPGEDSVKYDQLKDKYKEFTENKVDEARQHIQDQQEAMASDCVNRSYEVEERMKAVAEELQTGNFIDAEKIPDGRQVVKELDIIYQRQLKPFEDRASSYKEYEGLLDVRLPGIEAEDGFNFQELEKTKALYELKHELWTTVASWVDNQYNWTTSDFQKVDVNELNKEVLQSYRKVTNLSNALPGDEVVMGIKESIEEFKEKVPCILDLGNTAMCTTHWDKIFQEIGMPCKGQSSLNNMINNMNLAMLEQNGVFEHREFVAETSATATGEYQLLQSLKQIEEAWEPLVLPILNHRNQKDLWILGDLADIITLCEGQSVSISTMMGSRFITGIKEKVEVWDKKIAMFCDVIDKWSQVQRVWMYLGDIFSAEDMKQQLPEEAAKFKSVDKFWKELFRKVRTNYKMAEQAFGIPNLLKDLKGAMDTLDFVQKRLDAYLEKKRAAFPRFYFHSSDLS